MTTLAERHKADQSKLAALLAREVAPLVAPQPSRSAVKELIDGLVALLTQYNRASAGVAAGYYEAQRAAAGVTDGFTVPLADPPDDDQLVHALGWATRDLTQPAVDLDAVQTRVDGATARLALDGGRATVIGAARADARCRGFVRTATPGACAFCAMLATRVFDASGRVQGVYRSEASAQRRGRGATEDKYHDDCRCMVRPIFRGENYQPAAHVRQWAETYAGATPDSGQSKLDAFRQALAVDRGEAAH